MQAIGVRELREHLSRVLAAVQDGETIVVKGRSADRPDRTVAAWGT